MAWMAINGPFGAIGRSGGSKPVDQDLIKLRHIRGNMLGPFPGSRIALRGRRRAPKWLKKAINGPFVAINRPGGSKLVDQGWINLGHIHGNVLGQFPGSGMAIGGRHMVQKGLSAFLWPFGLFIALLDHDGHSGSGKRFQHIAPDVPGLDPTVNHADPPVWSP